MPEGSSKEKVTTADLAEMVATNRESFKGVFDAMTRLIGLFELLHERFILLEEQNRDLKAQIKKLEDQVDGESWKYGG